MKYLGHCVVALLGLCPGLGCADTQQSRVAVALHVSGSDVSSGFVTSRGVSVALERADLAFGPLYLCASTEAGEACETARGEWLDSAVVDALDATPQEAGELLAVNGPYRSFMYDLGIASLLTKAEPVVLGAAEELGDVSVVLEGRVTLDDVETPFSIAMPIARTSDNELGVPVVRVRASEDARHDIHEGDTALNVRFDPRPWLMGVDFATVCGEAADCLELDPNGQAGRAVRNALTAGTPPALEWN